VSSNRELGSTLANTMFRMTKATIRHLNGKLFSVEHHVLCEIVSSCATLVAEAKPAKLVDAGRLFSGKLEIELHVIEPPIGAS